MNLHLNEQQQLVVRTAREFAERELAPLAAELDAEGRFHVPHYLKMAELGLLMMNVPGEYGGSETGAVAYCLSVMELARCCAATTVGMAVTNMVAEMVWKGGSEEQRALHLPRFASGEYVTGSFVLTESGYGSDAGHLKTSAVRRGDRYVLNGSKIFITSGSYSGLHLVMARTDRERPGAAGVSAFLVEKGTPGLSIGKKEHKMGLRGSDTVELVFEDCEIPVACRLGGEGEGFKVAMTSLDSGRLGVASQAVGIATAAFEAAVSYARERKQFGKSIADFQAIQWMIADSATELDAARLLVLRAAALKEMGRRFTREASMAKLYATETAKRICNRALQVHGGYGYVSEYPVERHLRDVVVTTIYEGTSEVQHMVIAREVLK